MKNILKIIGAVIVGVLWFTVGLAIIGYILALVLIVTSPILLIVFIIYKYRERHEKHITYFISNN